MKKNGRKPDESKLIDLSTREGRQALKASVTQDLKKRDREAELNRKALSESLREDRKERKK